MLVGLYTVQSPRPRGCRENSEGGDSGEAFWNAGVAAVAEHTP